MSTHKRFIQELKPITFITFDQDSTWDHDSRYLVYEPTLYDESENGDPVNGILHIDDDTGIVRPSYYMGQTSMIENHKVGIYSMVIAPHSFDSKNAFRFAKTFVEIPYTNRLEFPYDFSYTMMFNFKNTVGNMRSYVWSNSLGVHVNASGNYNSLRRTIIQKGVQFSLVYVDPYSSQNYLEVKFPNNSGNINISNIAGGITDRDIHFVATHKYIVMEDGRYYTESKVYIDMIVVYSHTSNPIYGDYVAGNTAPIFLCGNQGAVDYNRLDDRWTSPIYIDQFAAFDYALEPETVSMLHRKIYSYVTMIKRGFPHHYFIFDEEYNDLKFVNSITRTGYDLYPRGNSQQVVFEQSGVHGVYGERCVKVQSGGMIYSDIPYDHSYFFNTSGDMTIEFFASFMGGDRGVIMSLQDDIYPFKGITLFANSKENNVHSGMVQLSITDTRYCHSPEFNIRGERVYYNDGQMHHYVIRRSGAFIELWIDGVLLDKVFLETGSLVTRDNSNLYLFNMSPSTYATEGRIQHMAFYTRALSRDEILARVHYLLRYRISGRVTVGGIGERVLIRVYSFNDGRMLLQKETNGDGEYNIDIHYGDYINIVFMKKGDITVRPRTVGALLADEYVDLPWE